MNGMSDDDRKELEKAQETMKSLNWFAWIVMVLFLSILGGAMMCSRALDEDLPSDLDVRDSPLIHYDEEE